MKREMILVWAVLAPALAAAYGSGPAASPGFTISAGNTTMPTSGSGAISFTLTSVDGFEGSIGVSCEAPNPPAGVREPQCGVSVLPPPFVLAANATATGQISLNPWVYVAPLSGALRHEERERDVSWALAGVLAIGLAFTKRRARMSGLRPGHLLLAVGMLVAGSALSGCGTGLATLTPGTYTYTLNATEVGNPSSQISTTLQVSVPPGVVIQTVPTTY